MAQTQTDDDDQIRGLWHYLTHPLSALSGLGGLTLALFDPGFLSTLWTATWASVGQVFPLLTLVTGYIAPMFPPTTRTEWVVMGFALLLFAKTLDTVLKKYDRYI